MTWLEPDDIAAFIADHDGGDVTVKYHPPTGIWSYDGWAPAGPARFRTDRYTMAEQVMRACNAKPVTVHVKQQVGDREITVVDPEATAAEQLCRDNLTEALQVWCWADPERATRLAGRYNRLFNRYRAEQWDGSHLTLPGLAADFTPRPHQKDVVWRILASADRGVLMAHGVGAGKTAAMIIAAQETTPHRPDRRHRPVRRARQHGRTVRPRLPAAVSGRPGADPARRDADGRGARVRRPDGHRRLRRRDLLAQPAQDDPAVARRRARGARAAARRLRRRSTRPRPCRARRPEAVGPPAGEGTGPPRRAEAGRRGPGGHLLRPDGCRDARRRRSPPGQEHPAQHRTPRPADARRLAARRGDPGPHRLRPLPPRRRRRSSWPPPPR